MLSPSEVKYGKAVVALQYYRAYSNYLRSIRRMVDACKGLEDHRESLIEFLTAKVNAVSAGPTRDDFKELAALDVSEVIDRPVRGDLKAWARSASIGDIRRVLASSVEDTLRSPRGSGFCVTVQGKRFTIRPSYQLYSLWNALIWMVWFDEWNRWPPRACPECQKIFRPSTAHKKKYCDYACAHRAANRKYRRQDLRRRKLETKAKGGANGPDKAR